MDAKINSPGTLAAEKARARGNKYSKEKRAELLKCGLVTMNTVVENIEQGEKIVQLSAGDLHL